MRILCELSLDAKEEKRFDLAFVYSDLGQYFNKKVKFKCIGLVLLNECNFTPTVDLYVLIGKLSWSLGTNFPQFSSAIVDPEGIDTNPHLRKKDLIFMENFQKNLEN